MPFSTVLSDVHFLMTSLQPNLLLDEGEYGFVVGAYFSDPINLCDCELVQLLKKPLSNLSFDCSSLIDCWVCSEVIEGSF